MRVRWFWLASCVALCAAGLAQDTLHVAEPTFPRACTVLHATLDWRDGALAAGQNDRLSTQQIQQAIDSCRPGMAVKLAIEDGHNALLSGPLEMKSGVTLLVDKGVHLVASNRPSDYDRSPGSCGMTDQKGGGCRPLIAIHHADHVGLMGDGVIEGRGDQVMAVGGMSWWQMHNQVHGDVHHNIPWLVGADEPNDLTFYRITLHNAPNFNIFLNGGNGITFWGIRIDAPWDSPNTDGIDPSGSTNVTVTHSFIRNGDDNIAIKAPAGKPATHMTIAHNHFYEGHGMSIGSGTEGGVSAIRVTDLSIDHQKAGLHIKSNPGRGGLVTDVVFDDVCIRNTTSPINLESTYIDANAPRAKWINGTSIPVYRGIVFHDVRTSGGTRLNLRGMDPQHRTEVVFDGVEIGDLTSLKQTVENATITLGPGSSNWLPKGEDVVVNETPRPVKVGGSCDGRFVPFPAQ